MTESLENQKEYWDQRWADQQTQWKLAEPHASLTDYIELIAPAPERDPRHRRLTVFVPLCGSSVDVQWLHENQYRVVGCELNEQAVLELFANIRAKKHRVTLASRKTVNMYANEDESLRVFQCNFFDLAAGFAHVDAVYDRAALVALPPATQKQYANHMMQITNNAPQILVVAESLQPNAEPPHSVSIEMINDYYGRSYNVLRLSEVVLASSMDEKTYLLTPK